MEENSNDFGSLKNKPRSKKLKPRIDLTAMVSISFLLIVFFMVTIELSKPRAMDLGMPDYGVCGPGGIVCGRPIDRTITVLLGDNNKVITYTGLLYYAEESPKQLNYGKDGIRKELIEKRKMIKKNNPARGAIVIIKPSKKCNFRNLVDILDEMVITNIETYAIIDDFSPEEMKLLASN